ncbi:hypothetical protein AAY473_020482 [Plecturocebus cupreus]
MAPLHSSLLTGDRARLYLTKKEKKILKKGKTILLGRLRQENCLYPGDGSCSELRSKHCMPAWVIARLCLKIKHKQKQKQKPQVFAKNGSIGLDAVADTCNPRILGGDGRYCYIAQAGLKLPAQAITPPWTPKVLRLREAAAPPVCHIPSDPKAFIHAVASNLRDLLSLIPWQIPTLLQVLVSASHFPVGGFRRHEIFRALTQFVVMSFICFLRQEIALLPRLECSGMTTVHSSLNLLGSKAPPSLASQVAGTTVACHHAQLIFKCFVEMGASYHQKATTLLQDFRIPTFFPDPSHTVCSLGCKL